MGDEADHDEQTPPPRRRRDDGITPAALHKWGPWFAAIILGIVTVTGTAVLSYAGAKAAMSELRADVTRLDFRVTAIDTNGGNWSHERKAVLDAAIAGVNTKIDDLTKAREADDQGRKELLRRLGNVEKFLATLVCKATPSECPQAMALVGQ